jgi:5-methylcytosine rRNA methyltransferase NSUN4
MRGPAAFEEFYGCHYGERWSRLREALLSPPSKVLMHNPFAGPVRTADASIEAALQSIYKDAFPVRLFAPGATYRRAERTTSESGVDLFYELDLASVCAALALPLVPGERWLDLCAAPGGKTLTRIFARGGVGETVATDISPARVARLKAVLHDYLPGEIFDRVKVFRRDAARWRARGEDFAAVLVDAPCSAEHHLLAKPAGLAGWTVKRSKGLAMRQHALLCAALELAAPGSHVLYSTCSVSPLENDAVIGRFLRKREGRVETAQAPVWLGERTRHGVEIFPDRAGAGPIYYSLLRSSDLTGNSRTKSAP